MRCLICLSDSYRSRLYDLLEATHPEAFYEGEDPALMERAAQTTNAFFREQLKKEGVKVNKTAFDMLYIDFIGSHHFYTRRQEYKKKKG